MDKICNARAASLLRVPDVNKVDILGPLAKDIGAASARDTHGVTWLLSDLASSRARDRGYTFPV
jgi:hypothetical protein